MPAFDSYACEACGEEFTALPGANAAAEGFCSPTCVTDGKTLG